ncbi:MAG: FAD-binding oxidoreductase [Bacteroidales bacterium]|jgi:D-lactate dehydrogenase|nr:FAD-binding oxidoreductase [Bacteroidales bacterium]
MNYNKLFEGILPADRIYTDEIRTLAWGTDASEYKLTPKAVLRAADEKEVSRVLELASRLSLPVTFRAAGTSLSGQAISDSILLVAGKHWEKWEYHEDTTVTLQPGIVGAKVNQHLAPYGRHFGPDPASIGSCMVGGIVANNASGMSCGTHANSDKMLLSARMVLADGTVLDTASEASRSAFRKSHPEIISGLEELHREVLADKELTRRILYKYSIKNVTGLNIRPLVVYEDPFEMLAHLLVGSEGTLAFLSEVTMKTLPITPYKASAMIYFPDIVTAAKAVVAMKANQISAAELLDKRSLTSVNDPHLKADVPDLTAVLTETQAATPEALQEQIKAITATLEPFGVEVRFSTDPQEVAQYWAIRSGIFPTVGSLRKEGTTCLIEDVAFHIEDLPAATADLSALLDRHGYEDSCIYGHALEGNFHFIINQAFETRADIERYDAMIRDVVELVVNKYDGSLKAEHGTGRNMASFVEAEWGEKAFGLMKRIKALLDPQGILNPGVIFNEDRECYLKHLKTTPLLPYAPFNKCIECGFCEVNCVSCGFTLSSRTRIAVQREIARRKAAGEPYEALEKAYKYPGMDTCAGDGLCSTSCPMGINVADLTHQLRQETLSPSGKWLGAWVAEHFRGTKVAIRGTLGLAAGARSVLGKTVMSGIGKGLHATGLPLWTPEFPLPVKVRKPLQVNRPNKVVYFPSCLNQTMGRAPKDKVKPLASEMVELLNKAGYEVLFPPRMESLCCGTIWESKGMPDVADKKVKELEEALWEASEQGKYPVLCDQSPCLHRMRQCIQKMKLYEPAEFIAKFLLDKLDFHPTDKPITVHVTCSTRLMGLKDVIIGLAKMCSTRVYVPEEIGCCAYAGDKGMTNPELNAYALRKLKPALQERGIEEGYSNSRTCEIGLSHSGGITYRSIVYLVNACTTPKDAR